jgi:hypothetical protein
MTDMPRTQVLMNADYDIVLFNALKIYYFRTTVGDIEMETPPDIELEKAGGSWSCEDMTIVLLHAKVSRF